jgi:hypothetical protein
MEIMGTKKRMNPTTTPIMANKVIIALSPRGKDIFLILILHSKLTSGCPIIERTKEINTYRTILEKNQTSKARIMNPRTVNIIEYFFNIIFCFDTNIIILHCNLSTFI